MRVGLAYQNFIYVDCDFIWGNYSDWYLNGPIWWSQHQSVIDTKPSIEYLDNGNYGVAFIGYNESGVACAYFNNSDWIGINENKSDNIDSHIMSLLPNPSIGNVKLSYTVQKPGNVTISVYDVTGRLVSILVNGVVLAGNYIIALNCQSFPAGTYFVQLKTPATIETKSLLIVR